MSHVLSSIPQVKDFAEEIGRSGKWNGEALEGFVVRTTVGSPPTDGKADAYASPYAPGSSFFFKIKFDEPYMMYRDWREITKSLLSRGESANLPKNKMKRPETKTYVEWVRKEIKHHPMLFEGYTKGHGIIATRGRFLEWLETDDGKKGKKKVETDEEASQAASKTFGKTIIMPIAVPGLGASHSPSTWRSGLTSTSTKAKPQSRWLLQIYLALDTLRAIMFEAKNLGPCSFKMSRNSCETMM